jgi:hypothetical protein
MTGQRLQVKRKQPADQWSKFVDCASSAVSVEKSARKVEGVEYTPRILVSSDCYEILLRSARRVCKRLDLGLSEEDPVIRLTAAFAGARIAIGRQFDLFQGIQAVGPSSFRCLALEDRKIDY